MSRQALNREDRLREAVDRAYASAGLQLDEAHAASLARVYDAWADNADDGIVDRIERALAASLGVRLQ